MTKEEMLRYIIKHYGRCRIIGCKECPLHYDIVGCEITDAYKNINISSLSCAKKLLKSMMIKEFLNVTR